MYNIKDDNDKKYNKSVSNEYFWKHIDQSSAMYSLTLATIGERFVNPFRQNKTKNTEIFDKDGILLFWDWGNSDWQKLNIISLTMKVKNLSYGEAKDQLWNDFITQKKTTRELNPQFIEKQKKVKKQKNYFCQFRKWQSYDDKYWNPYGITEDDCTKGKLFPISYFYLINEEEPGSIKYNSSLYPIYVWIINGKKKFYLPLLSKKEKRFISTFSTNDLYYHDDYSSDTLFIGSSWKDVTVIKKETGFAVRGVQGEGGNPSQALLDCLSSFKRIIISFDNDEEGYKANWRFFNIISKLHNNVEVWYLNSEFNDYAECKKNNQLKLPFK